MQTIAEVMTPDVEVVRPDETLQRVAQRMDELNVGSLPVCDGNRLLGIVTDRDITVRAVAAGLSTHATHARDVMTAQMRCCSPEQTVEEVMRTMGDVQIRRLPVIDRDRRLVGIVSLGDLATRHGGHTEMALREISMPSQPDR